jgi:hypothetical protein
MRFNDFPVGKRQLGVEHLEKRNQAVFRDFRRWKIINSRFLSVVVNRDPPLAWLF